MILDEKYIDKSQRKNSILIEKLKKRIANLESDLEDNEDKIQVARIYGKISVYKLIIIDLQE